MHVVITGASSGIGRDLAKAFAVAGSSLSLVARRKGLLDELGKELDVPSQSIEADLADPRDPTGWLERAEHGFGAIDLLVNNAGISYVEPTHQVDADRIRAIFQINTHAPIAAVQHVLPGMLERKRGTIVGSIGSRGTSRGSRGSSRTGPPGTSSPTRRDPSTHAHPVDRVARREIGG